MALGTQQTDADKLKSIEAKLDLVIRLLGMSLVANRSKTDAILALSKVGLDRTTIAELAGTTPNTVSVTLSELRRKTGAKKTSHGSISGED